MLPLARLSAAEARRLRGVIFDLDDTLLDHGALGEAAYASLFRLRDSGLRLIACTGRPAGWGEVIQRQWPLDATVVENGAVALVGDEAGSRRVVAWDPLDPAARRARRRALLELAAELVARFPEAELADDNDARRTDVTIDIGEHRRVAAEAIAAMQRLAADRGVRTVVSSVHLHLTLEPEDKASGTIRLLVRRFAEDATAARSRYAFIGDSGNDAAPFAAFALTVGVANVRAHAPRLSVPPRFVTDEPMGQGFAAFAARLIALRAAPDPELEALDTPR
jgi:HAD superfamily hydrolase (TIGR01484 family)